MKSRIISSLFAAIAFAAFPATINADTADSGQITVTMNSVSNSGQTGTAKFSREEGTNVTIAIALTGVPTDVKEPAMIHAGSCSDEKPVAKVTLNPVVNGVSITTQKGPMLSPGTYTIMVHKDSGSGINTIVSCGEFELK